MLIDFHRRMLADRVRHDAFRRALSQLIRPGATTVADIGAGTGILSFFARELGAHEVWLYEHGSVIQLAETLAARNGIGGLHFVQEHSLHVEDPPQVDVVVAEVLGNFVYEEGVLDTLRDARRFLKPGGVLMPESIVQHVAPVISARFDRELASWRTVGYGLDLEDAERISRNNLYVHTIEPADLMPGAVRDWDSVRFLEAFESRRAGAVHWAVAENTHVFGFALWWTCGLAPGVELSTSPYSPRTHWEQIYLPLLEPVAAEPADVVELSIRTETGGDEAGIAVEWSCTHRRGGRVLSRQDLDIGSGYVA